MTDGRGGQRGAEVPPPPLPELGVPWSVRVPDGEDDLALIHGWMHAPHVVEFWEQDWPKERWRKELATQLEGDHSLPLLVARDGEDFAYVEVYRVLRDRIGGLYRQEEPRDLGVHIAIGGTERTGQGLGTKLLGDVANALLEADPLCPKVVAEPSALNGPSLRAFRRAGFEPSVPISLPEKTATLMVFPRT